MYDKAELFRLVLSEINATDALSDDDIAWISTVIQRPEPQQDGLIQCAPIINACAEYNKVKATLTPFQDYCEQKKLAHVLFTLRSMYYRQRRILVACPQRKQHMPDGSNPPNLGGIIAPQAVRVEADQCFGLDHVEARNYFVRKCLAGNVYSHILFVDEDQLLPLNALSYLSSLNLDAVGLNYVKKNPMLESISTETIPDSRDVYCNQSVSAEDPTDLTPRVVNCLGLGALLVDVEVFRRVPEPWFRFQMEPTQDGSPGRLMLGEDSHFCRAMLLAGIKTYIIPGMVAPHCDFKTGKFYGPTWLCDPATRTIRPEHVEHYTHFLMDPKKLYEEYDNSDIFGRGKPQAA